MTTTEDTMSKLVGALLLELVADVPDKPGYESVKADLLAASQAASMRRRRTWPCAFIWPSARSFIYRISWKK